MQTKPVIVWVDDSVAHEAGDVFLHLMRRMIEEQLEDCCKIELFEGCDDAIPFVLDNAPRVFMVVQDSNRRPGTIIPAWKKLRPTHSPSIGSASVQGDFYTYVIDAFVPRAAVLFAGFSFSSDENTLISAWSERDPRVRLVDKMRNWARGRRRGADKSAFARLVDEQLDRWLTESQPQRNLGEVEIVAPLAEEMAVICGTRPEQLDALSPRQFEELIAALFHNHGFDVELTAPTRDGGYDVVATHHAGLTQQSILVEVKHFAPNRPVGVGIVRELYGVKHLQGASRAILVTSSYVSQYAHHEFSRVIPWELDFVERTRLLDWCRQYASDLLDSDD